MEETKEIPVLIVWKNNSIVKNIFLVNTPPSVSKNADKEKEEECYEETFVMGRHPDCDIQLQHPSISRFHLRLHSIPSQHLLFLTDLSSVHGTWVSGKRIGPNTRTRFNENDTLRIAGSSRIYKLHWIPLSQAYDVSQTFVPPLNFQAQQIIDDEDNNDVEMIVAQMEDEEINEEEMINAEINVEALNTNVDQSLSNNNQQEIRVWSFWSGKIGVKSPCFDAAPMSQAFDVSKPFVPPLKFPDLQQPQEEIYKEGISLKDQQESQLWSFWSGKMAFKSVCSSCSDAEPLSESEGKSSVDGYQSSSPCSSLQSSSPKALDAVKKQFGSPQFSDLEVFTSDKENLTPNTQRSARKLPVLKDVQNLISSKSPLKMTPNPNNGCDNFMSPSSGKENYSYKTIKELKPARHASSHQVNSNQLKERKVERMPFQLLADFSQKSVSQGYIADTAVGSGLSVNFSRATNKSVRQWKVIVDTGCLLNKDSRKALQLLEGLKGTQLIIPAIVIREMACLKRLLGILRRNTEVSLALEWIQECMVKAPWWIHIQSLMEEGQTAASTPPVSPHSQFSCGLTASYALAAAEFQPFSPTVEDDVLDYALHCRRIEKPGQVILLSNDTTLKIKAMAEGLVCETAEEFRNNLVNPFSERFLWTGSSPRGQTWSCSDDFILREMFYPSSLKMTPKAMGNVKGLKLIPYLEQTSCNQLRA